MCRIITSAAVAAVEGVDYLSAPGRWSDASRNRSINRPPCFAKTPPPPPPPPLPTTTKTKTTTTTAAAATSLLVPVPLRPAALDKQTPSSSFFGVDFIIFFLRPLAQKKKIRAAAAAAAAAARHTATADFRPESLRATVAPVCVVSGLSFVDLETRLYCRHSLFVSGDRRRCEPPNRRQIKICRRRHRRRR